MSGCAPWMEPAWKGNSALSSWCHNLQAGLGVPTTFFPRLQDPAFHGWHGVVVFVERGVLGEGLPSAPVLGVGGEVLEAMLTWDAVHSIIPIKAPELTSARSPLCGEGREERFFSSSAVQHPPGALCIMFLTQQYNLFFSKPPWKQVLLAGLGRDAAAGGRLGSRGEEN